MKLGWNVRLLRHKRAWEKPWEVSFPSVAMHMISYLCIPFNKKLCVREENLKDRTLKACRVQPERHLTTRPSASARSHWLLHRPRQENSEFKASLDNCRSCLKIKSVVREWGVEHNHGVSPYSQESQRTSEWGGEKH